MKKKFSQKLNVTLRKLATVYKSIFLERFHLPFSMKAVQKIEDKITVRVVVTT